MKVYKNKNIQENIKKYAILTSFKDNLIVKYINDLWNPTISIEEKLNEENFLYLSQFDDITHLINNWS